MKISIGSKYAETKEMLRRLLREGFPTQEINAKRHTCYFCGKRIAHGNKMRILETIDGKITTKYSLCESCYQDSTRYLFDEWDRISFSLS